MLDWSSTTTNARIRSLHSTLHTLNLIDTPVQMSSARTSAVFAFANKGSGAAHAPFFNTSCSALASCCLLPQARPPTHSVPPSNGGAMHAAPPGSRGESSRDYLAGMHGQGSVLEQSEQFLFGGSYVVREPGHEEDVGVEVHLEVTIRNGFGHILGVLNFSQFHEARVVGHSSSYQLGGLGLALF